MNRIWSFQDNAVDTIKGLSIVFIVFYHIHSISTHLSFIIESVALPSFMCVSGILYFRHTLFAASFLYSNPFNSDRGEILDDNRHICYNDTGFGRLFNL